jgi:anion-transporting  ArsA/GET3 family ATPase
VIPDARATATVPWLDLDALVTDPTTRILVLCGSGGVGKTTAAAALALRAAERGRRTCVLTIDPARRLAQSMGLDRLDNTPRAVDGVDTDSGGSLDAMMLDMKRTFDELVEAHADPQRAQAIFANPFYQSLSTSFSGTQEYMAMEKLGQLQATAESSGRWDLIVVDTPPSRSALDFLDAPDRLGSFLDGRLITMLLAPARVGRRAYLRAFGARLWAVSGIVTRLLGAQILSDLQALVAAFDTTFGGFRERAAETSALLRDDGTRFLVAAVPEPDALREAASFTERLREDHKPLSGLVLNRGTATAAPWITVERSLSAAEDLSERPEYGLTEHLLRLHAERAGRIRREHQLVARYTAAFPDVPVAMAVAQATDVHDLAGLRAVGVSLADRRTGP